ncbi:MAG: response regulator [Rhodospirillales bacterium]|nr:response regulator [Rhodospirillales bacterium]
MAVYDLDRINILLVEDNKFIRRLFADILRRFKVGQVLVAKNGAEAVEMLKVSEDIMIPGFRVADIVISDLMMAPIDGLLFLRWLRSSKDSPNRFMPFVMLSGAADSENVKKARDLGATEFLAKPFAVETVYKHILEIIDRPRPFITSREYFGPDRRRRDDGPEFTELRVTKDSDITLVYSADRVVKPKGPSDVWKFVLPNSLKDKVGGIRGGELGEIPSDLLEEAEATLERAALDFTDWAETYLANLSGLCDQALEQKQEARRRYFAEINMLAHELRGQGGTFGYPLISVFGKGLYEVTGIECEETDNAVEIVKAHVDVMRAVLREKIAGDGGEVGRELKKTLEAGIEKLMTVT